MACVWLGQLKPVNCKIITSLGRKQAGSCGFLFRRERNRILCCSQMVWAVTNHLGVQAVLTSFGPECADWEGQERDDG